MRASSIAIKIIQALLLVAGAIWVFVICKTHLDECQIPGFLIAMSISWWLTPEIRARALKLDLVDKPGERRIHKVPIPRLGGVAIYIGVMLTMAALIAMTGRFPKDARGGEGGLAGIAIGGTLIFVLGLLDDLESLSAKIKLLVQILAACAAYSLGVRIRAVPIPWAMNIDFSFLHLHGTLLDLKWMSLPVTVFWLVGIANAVNLIDGMDGLAAGVSAISALTIWSVSLAGSLDRPYSALLAAVLAGALLGFLRWNFNPARIFLGDSGAYLVWVRTWCDLDHGSDQRSDRKHDHRAMRIADSIFPNPRYLLGYFAPGCPRAVTIRTRCRAHTSSTSANRPFSKEGRISDLLRISNIRTGGSFSRASAKVLFDVGWDCSGHGSFLCGSIEQTQATTRRAGFR